MKLLVTLLVLAFMSSVQGASLTGVDFDALDQQAGELPALHSLLVSHRGDLVFERYYAGKTRSDPANMKSASKSIISALVGIAIQQGLIEGVDQPITDFFPEMLEGGYPQEKRGITIGNLLTMQSGLESTSNRNYGRWVLSDNWIEFALNQPLRSEPGSAMIYSTGSTHLLSAIITRASGTSTRDFAQKFLATPLGIRLAYWSQDPQGIYFGGNDLEMTPRHMLAFGELYLNEGIHEDEQILAADWIARSHQPHAISPRGQGRYYGYGWWLRDLAGMQVPLAWGYGGQLIFVVDELDLVIVATSDSTPRPDRFGHLSRLYDLVETQILQPAAGTHPAISDAPGSLRPNSDRYGR